MFEKVKSSLLFILILNSLILSGILWFKQPVINRGDYQRYGEKMQSGKNLQLSDLIQPSSVIFHLGNNQHTKALPETTVYQNLKKDMIDWNFLNFSPVALSENQWLDLLDKKKGMELQYPLAIPSDVLSELCGMAGLSRYIKEINRIWIYVDSKSTVTYALFLSDKEHRMVLARSSITSMDLNQYYFSREKEWNLPLVLPKQNIMEEKEEKVYEEIHYLTTKRQSLPVYRYFYIKNTPQQAVASLFNDPGAARLVTEKDGTLFYTDGSIGVTIPPSSDYFSYNAPSPISSTDTDVVTSLKNGLHFINGHGGFGGDYFLKEIDNPTPAKGESINYKFQSKLGTYPLYKDQAVQYEIYLQTMGGTVTNYNRPLIQLDTYFEKKNATLMSGSELLQKLTEMKIDLKSIVDIQLAYQEKVVNDYIEMTPVWAVERKGAAPLLFPSIVQEGTNQGVK